MMDDRCRRKTVVHHTFVDPAFVIDVTVGIAGGTAYFWIHLDDSETHLIVSSQPTMSALIPSDGHNVSSDA